MHLTTSTTLIHQARAPDVQQFIGPSSCTKETYDNIISKTIGEEETEKLGETIKWGVLGKTIADVHVIEFQKRGLPHAHILLIFAPEDKIRTVDDYDALISASFQISTHTLDYTH